MDAPCPHEPRCTRTGEHYCWPEDYVSMLAHHVRAEGLDPVQMCQRSGRVGLASRVREYLDQWFAGPEPSDPAATIRR